MDENIKEEVSEEKTESGLGSFLFTLIVCIGIALLIRFFVFNITLVDGDSMYPSLLDGDKLITQKVSLYFKDPELGDVVVIKAPDGSGYNYIKRIIAMEGDVVEIFNGGLYVNGQLQTEDYINGNETYENIPGQVYWEIPEDHVFVLGDNRGRSNDSRSFGPIPMDLVEGISEFRILPLDSAGKI